MIFAYLFIVIGIVLLGDNLGFLDGSVWRLLWDMWPVLLILAGLNILLGHAKWRVVAIILSVLIVLGTLWVVIYRAGGIDTTSYPRAGIDAKENKPLLVDETLSSDVERAKLHIDLGAQDMKIGSTSSGLISGTINSRTGTPQLKVKPGATTEVSITNKMTWRFYRFWGENQPSNLSLSNQVPFDIDLDMGAASLDADLSGVEVESLTLDAGATTGTFRFGSEVDNVAVKMETGASTVKVYVPKDSGVKVTADKGATTISYKNITVSESGDTTTSNDYDTASKKIDFEIDAGASTFEFIGY